MRGIALALSTLSTIAIAYGSAGCRTLDRFDTKDGEAYCGNMVRGGDFRDGFVATNTGPKLRLRVRIDTDNLTTAPGTLTSNDDDSEPPPGVEKPEDSVVGL